jgi:hypothetical protein
MEKFERQATQEKISEFEDFRDLDLSEKDLSATSSEILATAQFDTKTIWPRRDKLPADFNPEKVIEEAKNPGLKIRELHKEGVDGRGIRVAIIDQTLSSEQGEFMPHAEYAKNIVDYKEYGDAEDEDVSMHGPAVASLLIGKMCGVAPGAELVYKATPSGRVFELRAKALMDIVESNKTAEPGKKVRIVSCSIGYRENNPEPGLDQWIDAIKKAEEEGIIVVDVSFRNGVEFIGGGTRFDKDNADTYEPALFLKEMDENDGGNRAAMVADRVVIPNDYRSMASLAGPEEYMYDGKGGMSWSVPYLAGLFALALQVNPNLIKQEIADAINGTASLNKNGLKVVNPRGFVEAIKNSSRVSE